MNKAKILVVEDDKAVRNLITTTLETQNYQYHTAEKKAARRCWRLFPFSRM